MNHQQESIAHIYQKIFVYAFLNNSIIFHTPASSLSASGLNRRVSRYRVKEFLCELPKIKRDKINQITTRKRSGAAPVDMGIAKKFAVKPPDKGKKGKRNTVSLDNFINVSDGGIQTSNTYEMLSDEEAPSTFPTTPEPPKTKEQRVPPIVVSGTTVGDVHRKIIDAGVVKYSTNTTRHGIVVRTVDPKDFKAVVGAFQSNKLNFYTHQLPQDRTTKVVVFGLPDMDIDEISSALADCKIQPSTVKKLAIKNKRYNDEAMYLLHFPKGSITIAELRQVKVVNHHRVSFEYYANKQGPIQCHNCQKYGHGEANCFRAPVCVKCAGAHKSNTCPLSKSSIHPEGKVAPEKLRCANCGDHHTANFNGCPARRVNSKPKRNDNSQKQPKTFNLNNTIFPPLSNETCINTPPLTPPGYASQLKSMYTKESSSSNNDIDLSEIGAIVEDVFSNLCKCKSKKDLISVIVQITAKYCFKSCSI